MPTPETANANLVAITKAVGTVMREYVDRAAAELLATIDARFAALPRPERGEKGEPGRDGFAPSIDDIVAQLLPLVPIPLNGKDGAPGERGEKGDPGEKGESGLHGAAGRDGVDGKDGKDGIDGKDGADGRDAVDLEIIPAIDERKHYPRGTYAMHRGGLWKSHKTTDAMSGWECLVCGTVGQRFEQRGARDFAYVVETSLGVNEFEFSIPTPLDVGVYKHGGEYRHGDGVSYGGSWWLAQRDTTDKPGESDAWRLTVKRGRDGKDGERGPEGKAIRVKEKADGA